MPALVTAIGRDADECPQQGGDVRENASPRHATIDTCFVAATNAINIPITATADQGAEPPRGTTR